MDSLFAGDRDEAVDGFRRRQDPSQQLGLLGIVRILAHAHGWTDIGRKPFVLGELVVFLKERKRLFRRKPLDVIRKWLASDADGLNFVSGRGKLTLGGAQQLQSICDLGAMGLTIQPDERGYSP